MIYKICFIALLTCFAKSGATSQFNDECVILLHGLARSDASMSKIDEALEEKGYITQNVDYPSRDFTVEKLAENYIPLAIKNCGSAAKSHFVTHSMGGILVRQYLHKNTLHRLKHVVMLGPPNKGSEVVDELADMPGFKLINGPAGMQLCTKKDCLPNTLGPANFSVGIIAGNRSMNLILSTMLPNPDDGKVSVESTKLEGMSDHITLPVNHPLMMNNPRVIGHVLHFLKHGRFSTETLSNTAENGNKP